MKANLLCGKETIRLEMPDSALLIENKPAEALVNPESAVLDALLHPIGTAPLKDVVKGRKSILPGISSFETMKFMHSFKVIDQLQQANCRLENNLFHQYAMEVTEIAGVDFILNVVINKERFMELRSLHEQHHYINRSA